MIEIIVSSFVQGMLTFFAPCSVALLPAYLAHFLQKHTNEKNKFRKTSVYALSSVAGISLIYAIGALLLFSVSSVLKAVLPYVVSIMGLILIVFGTLQLFNKAPTISTHFTAKSHSSYIEAFLFGITYGIGALGCLFPLFLLILTQALGDKMGFVYLIAYGLGMATLMFVFYFLAIIAKEFLQKSIVKIVPYITRISGVVIIIGGIYIIWYQSALLF